MLDLHGYGPSILAGTWLTIQISLLSLMLAAFLGMITALAKLSHSRPAVAVASTYTTIIRGVPDLLLMLIIFFGGQTAVNSIAPMLGYDDYIDINPFVAGVITIGFIFGAYMAETFRGAILAVPAGQLEAGRAYGMPGFLVFRRILLPQMIRHAIPSFGNNWLVLLKTTALVSVVGLQDVVYIAGAAGRSVREPFTFYFAVAIIYLALTSASVLVLRWAEKRYALGFEAR